MGSVFWGIKDLEIEILSRLLYKSIVATIGKEKISKGILKVFRLFENVYS